MEHCTPASWQEEETGGVAWKKKTAAALTAVSMVRLLTWQSPPLPYAQNPLPPQLVFDMLKYRERDRENRAFERDSLQTWHQAYLG